MNQINSQYLQTVTRFGDEDALMAWAKFYEINGILVGFAKRVLSKEINLMAVFGDWPPTHPGEFSAFEDNWLQWHVNASGVQPKDLAGIERVKFKHRIDRPRYAPTRRSRTEAAA